MSGRRALLVLLAAAVGCGGASGSDVRALRSVISVEPASVDFGDVALGKDERTNVVLRNDSLVQVAVDRLPGSLGAFDVAGLPVTLPPAGSATVEVRYRPPALGRHGKDLQFVTDVKGEAPDLGLKGRAVLGLAQISGNSIDFGNVVVDETAVAILLLSNNDGRAKTAVRIDTPQGNDTAAFRTDPVGELPLRPEESLQVKVEFTPFRLGDFRASVPVTPCPTCEARTVDLSGRGVERLLAVEPAAIDFGEVHLGTEVSRPFSVTSIASAPLTVSAISVANAQFVTASLDGAAVPLTLAPGQRVTGVVRFKPMALGNQAGQVQLTASDGAPGVIDVRGLGMGPVVQVRKTLYVGATMVGTTRTASLTVTNVGLDPSFTSPLNLSRVSIEPPDAAWGVTPGSASVGEPGSSLELSVSFTPPASELDRFYQTKLVIESNDDLHPRIEVQVAALGRTLPDCNLRVVPGPTVDFGVALLWQPTVQGYELFNDTASDCIVGDPKLVSNGGAFSWPGGAPPVGRQLPPGARMSVRVQFLPPAAQRYTGSVTFYVSNRSKPSMTIDLVGTGESSCFFVTPGTVDFGPATQGCSSLSAIARAVNQCAFPVDVTDATLSGPPFFLGPLALPITLQPNTSADIPMTYRAGTLGDDVGWLRVSSNARLTPFQIGLTAGTLPSQAVQDEFAQSTPKVDLLIVIDNSGSMAEEQRALAANLDRLWNRIALARADFHIAVTTSGMLPYRDGWSQCPGGASGGEGGRFFPVDGSRPRILTPETPDVKNVLFANTDVGTCQWDERFLDPVIAALTPPLLGSSNAGFLRDDARLALLAVTDTDDAADIPNPPPVSQYVRRLTEIKHGVTDLISFSGLVPLHNCSTAEGVGTRFQEIALQLHGHLEDICDLGNFGNLLESSLGNLLLPLTSFKLTRSPKDGSGIEVEVDGVLATGWSYDPGGNRVVFSPGSVPPPGSHIAVRYQVACN